MIALGIMLTICMGAIVHAYGSGRRKYISLRNEIILEGGDEESKLEKGVMIGSLITMGILVVFFSICAFRNTFYDVVFMWILFLYLIFYYAMEYVAHYKWCILKDGIRSSRQLQTIGWENVVGYQWYDRRDLLILRISYKGKGIMTRKSDYVVKYNQRMRIEEIIKEKSVVK